MHIETALLTSVLIETRSYATIIRNNKIVMNEWKNSLFKEAHISSPMFLVLTLFFGYAFINLTTVFISGDVSLYDFAFPFQKNEKGHYFIEVRDVTNTGKKPQTKAVAKNHFIQNALHNEFLSLCHYCDEYSTYLTTMLNAFQKRLDSLGLSETTMEYICEQKHRSIRTFYFQFQVAISTRLREKVKEMLFADPYVLVGNLLTLNSEIDNNNSIEIVRYLSLLVGSECYAAIQKYDSYIFDSTVDWLNTSIKKYYFEQYSSTLKEPVFKPRKSQSNTHVKPAYGITCPIANGEM